MLEELQEVGLSKNEAIAYLKLSEMGLSSAYKLAKEAGLFKANSYDALRKLVEKGLVSEKKIDKKTLYEAMDPSSLLDFIDSKREKVRNLLSIIRLKQKTTNEETSFNVSKGVNSVINLLYHFHLVAFYLFF